MQIDPVCGMQVDENTAQYKSDYKGKTYYFCAPGCKKSFEAEPENTSRRDLKEWAKSSPGGRSGSRSINKN